MILSISNLPVAIKPAYDEATRAQGPGVGAESANAGGVWGGRSPLSDPGGPNYGLIRSLKGL